MQTIKTIACLVFIFLILDLFWLGFIAKGFYIRYMGDFINVLDGRIQARWIGALWVYIALIVGIYCFVFPLADGSTQKAFFYGALFGFVTYSTYDATNLAVIKDWPLIVTVVDVIWGMVICSVSSGLTVWITSLSV